MSVPDRSLESRWPRVDSLTAVVLGALALVIAFDAALLKYFERGVEGAIVMLAFWPITIALGITYAVAHKGSHLPRVLMVLIGLGAPGFAILAREGINAVEARVEQRHQAELAARARDELEFLREYLRTPRTVVFTKFPYVVVEGGYSLVLFDVERLPGNSLLVDSFLQDRLVGSAVTATFPPDFAVRYRTGNRSPITRSYAAGPSQDFGDAPAMITSDGVEVNADLRIRFGSLSRADSLLLARRFRRDPVAAESTWTLNPHGRYHLAPGQNAESRQWR